MKKLGTRLLGMMMVLSLCFSLMIPVAGAADWDLKSSELTMTAFAQKKHDGTYDVTYKTKLVSMADDLGKIVALYKDRKADLKGLRFECQLTDKLSAQLTDPKESDFTFAGPGADNYDLVSVTNTGDGIKLVYKLDPDLVDSWAAAATQTVHDRIIRGATMTATQNVTADQLDKAKTGDTVQAVSTITLSHTSGSIPHFTGNGYGSTIKLAEAKAAMDINEDPNSYRNCPRDESCPIWPFTDAGTREWYHDPVHYCLAEGIMVGTGVKIFEPNSPTTRGMIVTMLYSMEGKPDVSASSWSFQDVHDGDWYAKAVCWAQNNKVAAGYDADHFGPNDPITREQLATIMYSYSRYKGRDITVGAHSILTQNDAETVSFWAVPAMKWANALDFITGKPDHEHGGLKLDPLAKTTRAEAAQMTKNYLELYHALNENVIL